MSCGHLLGRVAHRERGSTGPQRMVGLVFESVEQNEDRVSSEALDESTSSTTIGTARSQYAFTMSITSPGERPSEKLVKPARSANITETSDS